jgi:unsaturated rhamnogalacturonyl hydrolase
MRYIPGLRLLLQRDYSLLRRWPLRPRVTAVLMALVAGTSVPGQLTAANTPHSAAPRPHAEILAIGAKVADWQLAHLSNFDYIPENQFRRDAEAPRDWVRAAFYIGLAAFADTTQNARYKNAILAQGEAEGWGFDERPRHADADAIGAVWVWAAERTHDPAKLGPIKARFDAVLANPSMVSLEFVDHGASCQDRWCWSDALFMAPPAWIALSKASGDERYLAHADQEFWATTNYLYDTEEHLFFRDSRYFTQRDAAGRKIFWSRGNGWVFAGLARILSELPKNHPSRPRYETLFQQMAAKLISLQGTAGYWPVSLLEPQKNPETSGTGFFVYGLAWGIHHGLLPSSDYRQAADRGWHALTATVSADGKLGWVQPIGAAPDRVSAGDTQLYGVGAFLLAASEMSALP